jgi:hypothetical protein
MFIEKLGLLSFDPSGVVCNHYVLPLLSGTKIVIGANTYKKRNFELSNKKLCKEKYLAN